MQPRTGSAPAHRPPLGGRSPLWRGPATAGRAAPEYAIIPSIAALPRIYVTGHRNPDTDSIAAAIGYAELMGRLDSDNDYKPVRLGDLNTQTRWVLDRADAREPDFLPHVMLRVRDVMRREFPLAADD